MLPYLPWARNSYRMGLDEFSLRGRRVLI